MQLPQLCGPHPSTGPSPLSPMHQRARAQLHQRPRQQVQQLARQQLRQLAQPWRLPSPQWRRLSPMQAPQPKELHQQVQQWARQQLHQLAQRRHPTKRRLPLNPFPLLPSKFPLVS